jgi:hypothetical protein
LLVDINMSPKKEEKIAFPPHGRGFDVFMCVVVCLRKP